MRTLILALSVILISACSGSKTESTSDQTLDHYLEIKNALVETDLYAAQKAANKMFSTDLPDQLKGPIMTIANTSTIETQRLAFEKLSIEMYQIISSNPVKGKMIYKQYCPMAFDNAGAFWLSAEEQVMNPYFGDMMLHCGSVKETIQ